MSAPSTSTATAPSASAVPVADLLTTKKQTTINLFHIPHSRMKELVELHLSQVIKIKDFCAADLSQDIDMLLQSVYQAMWELKSHEYIENHFIMDRLKARLQARRVYNQLVCNCHEDSKLLGVIRLVEKVYSASNETDRKGSGRELQAAIQDFLHEFLHHMEEEEKVFQPLLDENFEAKELADMNEQVLRQHSLFRQKVQTEKTLTAIKRKRDDDVFDEFDFGVQELRFRKSYCQEVEEIAKGKAVIKAKKAKKVDVPPPVVFTGRMAKLPEETGIHLMSFLQPKDLLRCAQVSKEWNKLALEPKLWRSLFPTLWARGDWRFAHELSEEEEEPNRQLQPLVRCSSSESLCEEEDEDKAIIAASGAEKRVLEGMISFLLPRVGKAVKRLHLTDSCCVTDTQIRSFLSNCPNMNRLELCHTRVSERALAGLSKLNRLESLDLRGCVRVGDELLEMLRFVSSKSKLKRINLSGCRRVTSYGISMLEAHRKSLEELDLSGCYMVDGQTLTQLAIECKRLRPERLAYCNDIEDGPYQNEANGCMNLECARRFCCQQLKN